MAVIEPMAADQLAEAGLAFHEGEDEFWTRIRALTDVARLARRSNGFGNNEPLEAAERELAGLDQLLAEHGKGSSLASDCALSIATDYCDAGFALGIATALRYAYGGR